MRSHPNIAMLANIVLAAALPTHAAMTVQPAQPVVQLWGSVTDDVAAGINETLTMHRGSWTDPIRWFKDSLRACI